MGQTESAAAGAFAREWYATMTKIWKDRIDLLGAIDTGRLRQSVSGAGFNASGFDIRAAFRFMQYGIYVDAGTGNGYRRGNGGNLHFLDKKWRKENRKGRARERKPWLSPSWRISREVLKNRLARIVGEKFTGIFLEMK